MPRRPEGNQLLCDFFVGPRNRQSPTHHLLRVSRVSTIATRQLHVDRSSPLDLGGITANVGAHIIHFLLLPETGSRPTELGPGGHPGTSLSLAWPASHPDTGSSAQPPQAVPKPTPQAGTPGPIQRVQNHPLDTKRLRYVRVDALSGCWG